MPKRWADIFRQGNAVYQLNVLGEAAIASIDRRFVDDVGFDIRTIRVLRLIGDNPGITFAEITALTGLERSLTSRLIQVVVRGGLVERRNFETDARRFGLHITALGQKVRARADLISARALDLIFHDMPQAEIAAFSRTMVALADRIDSDEYRDQISRMFEALQTEGAEA
ncbi:MAG: MarR family winged helix-turn-helix transcriptional regulator [Tropicimonas sp.]|uniref:MarR family winged helix-turn-helix transcriptional regulator n=1 Tax=Tropicimonas sp. TaxID=2067044 RepID=UPI003A87449F